MRGDRQLIVRNGKRRRGMILITALVAIGILGIILSVGIRILVSQRGHLRQEARRIQGEVLVASAFRRAQSRLKTDPKYAGETWTIPAEELAGGAEIGILISDGSNDAEQREIQIQVKHPNSDEGIKLEELYSWKRSSEPTEKP